MESEGEGDELSDGMYPWVRVATYWRETSALKQMIDLGFPGATDCASSSNLDDWAIQSSCRTFIVSNAWSAAFVSYVLMRADLKEFQQSHKHITYIRDAHEAAPSKPYRLANVEKERPIAGDLLCYSRAAGVNSYEDLIAHIASGDESLNTHCDVVVSANFNGDSKLYVIGGNVLQTVMMRKLSLNSFGHLSFPKRASQRACHVNAGNGCSLSEKRWVALLKLQTD
jgi:Uncharacterized protein conserved in bacteria